MDEFVPPAGDTALLIDFSYPAAAFLYASRKPRLFIDGVEQPVTGWGRHRFPLAPGSHKIQVYVPYTLPRRAGKADLEVTAPADGDVAVEYVAPTITAARGALGAPGQQVSTGASAVRTANIVAVVVVVLGLVALLVLT